MQIQETSRNRKLNKREKKAAGKLIHKKEYLAKLASISEMHSENENQ